MAAAVAGSSSAQRARGLLLLLAAFASHLADSGCSAAAYRPASPRWARQQGGESGNATGLGSGHSLHFQTRQLAGNWVEHRIVDAAVDDGGLVASANVSYYTNAATGTIFLSLAFQV